MTHLVTDGEVFRVYGAPSPVPPRLPHFATPWSVRHLATVVSGAYPLRRAADVWLPGLLAPSGPCYLLVASGTPAGWCRGCLAAWLVRSTVSYYCLSGAVPWSCVRGARSRSRGSGLVPVLASPPGLLPALASLAVHVAGCPARVSLSFGCWYAITCGLCVSRARSGCPSGPWCVAVACLCAHAPAVCPSPPLVRFGARTTCGSGAGRR